MEKALQIFKHLVRAPGDQDPLMLKSWMPKLKVTWDEHLEQLSAHDICMFGYPSDAGSSTARGASEGPDAIRKSLFSAPAFDLGNLNIIPQFLSDKLLKDEQIKLSQSALYSELDEELRAQMPVSPIEMCSELIKQVLIIKPEMKFVMIGGDQSASWALAKTLVQIKNDEKIGLIHFDAHSDLDPHFCGIEITNSSWLYNLMRDFIAPEHVIQLGIRDDKELTYGQKVLSGRETLQTSPKAYAQDCCEYLLSLGITKVYFSNDISASDSSLAPACGHTIPNGLYPHHINTLIEELPKRGISLIASDLMEVAPRIGTGPGSMSTCRNAAQYIRKQVEAMKAL
ncbi:Arginase/agmatinase/formiminoglutamase [Lentisphaera araneosa HTCC2155]|uniref:Arginase/agmatinase/formiminoglutamase n=1 Tax=Lentisphaera araneosa HTCC2155 TaxID=313628 RepID=A6DI52_9BACT|nr:arginase family protein [Lentisphaera araneosa]EDM28706.1 Arginase/agmatinase/formiminoglutamase [Lentisphaera araneosa HTCC2155]